MVNMFSKMTSWIVGWKGGLLFAAVLFGMLAPAAAQNVISAPGMNSPNSAWTIYAFGNAQAVADSMRALTNFTASTIFQSLVAMIAILGVLSVGASSGFSGAVAKKFIGYAVAVLLMVYVMFGVGSSGPLVVNVEVQDTVDSTWVAPVTVPAVVGIPAAMISTAGHHIQRQIEASFAMPDELKMSNGAPFNLAASMIADGARARIVDPDIAGSMATYVQDCFAVAVVRGEKNVNTLLTSTNFIDDIRVDLRSVYVDTTLGEPRGLHSVVSCDVAHGYIKSAIDALGSDADDFMTNASAYHGTPASSIFNAGVSAAAQYASNNGVTDGGAMVKQAAVLSSFTGAFRQSAAATGNSDFLTGLAVTQAHEAQKNGWIMGAEVFNRIMGYVYAVIQVFVYAVTPLILAAALIPSLGFALLKNFCQILLWLAIWQPMLGIVNFIIISMQQAELGGIMNNGGGAFGYTLSNLGAVSERTATMRAASTFVGTMVPMLAWALVKGSMDFSRIISSAVGENFAAGAANTATTGNYSLNQASMDSFTANKHSLGHTGDWSGGMSSTGQGGINSKIDMGGTSLSSGDQKIGVTTSGSIGASNGGQTGEGTNRGTTGSEAVSGTRASALAKTAGNTTANTGAHTAASQAAAGASAGYGYNPAAKGGARSVAGRGGSGDGNGSGDGQANPPGEFRSPLMDAVKKVAPRMDANLSAGASTSQSETNATTKTRGVTATHTDTGSLVNTRNDQAGWSENAGTTAGWQRNVGQQVTGMSTMSDRYDAMRSAMTFQSRFDGPGPAVGSAEHAWLHGSNENSVSGLAKDLNTNGNVQAQVAKNQEDVQKLMDAQRKDAERFAERAERAEGAKRAAADRNRTDLEQESKDADALGHKPLIPLVAERLKANAEDLQNSDFVQTVSGKAGEARDAVKGLLK